MIENRFILFTIISFVLISACNTHAERADTASADTTRIKALSKEALDFCRKNNFNTEFCFIVDMSIHSGKNRFLVYNFNSKNITHEGLVTHGCGRSGWGNDASSSSPRFSNTCDSHLSSLGKYKIGERGYSQWGIHIKYLLHGLEATNSNALKRTIVLHSWDAVPDNEIFPRGAAESWGCPAVSNNFMLTLDEILKSTAKPVLLWVVN